MSTLTYDQAVKMFTKRAEELENNFQLLTTSIEKFISDARKSLEKSERKEERAMLKKLAKNLK